MGHQSLGTMMGYLHAEALTVSKAFTSTRFDGWGERKKHPFHARTSGTGLLAIWPRFRRLVSSD